MRFIRLAAIIVLAAVTGKNNEDKIRNSSDHVFFVGVGMSIMIKVIIRVIKIVAIMIIIVIVITI